MPKEVIKLMRSPIDTNCLDCRISLAFGIWIYYNAETGDAICIKCGSKRGWSSKQRVKNLIKKLELQEDIRTLRSQRKLELEKLLVQRREISIIDLAARDVEIEQQILDLMDSAKDYLSHVGSPEERSALEGLFKEIRKNQELQKEIREIIHTREFFIERKKKKFALLGGAKT